jgi:cytoskeletal protein RodZ
MLTDEPTSTKDNSTNAEDRPAVDQEVKEMAEVSTSWEMAPLAPIPLDL